MLLKLSENPHQAPAEAVNTIEGGATTGARGFKPRLRRSQMTPSGRHDDVSALETQASRYASRQTAEQVSRWPRNKGHIQRHNATRVPSRCPPRDVAVQANIFPSQSQTLSQVLPSRRQSSMNLFPNSSGT